MCESIRAEQVKVRQEDHKDRQAWSMLATSATQFLTQHAVRTGQMNALAAVAAWRALWRAALLLSSWTAGE